MDNLDRYRQIIRTIIEEYAQYKPSIGEIEVETILDEGKDHYELIHTGWTGPYRVHGSVIHIDIRDGKVWLQHDGTDAGIADELVEAGIPRDKIVLGFKAPEIRPYTGFAIA
jgi:hypothetical protein